MLIYTNKQLVIPGIPPRDLTDEEVERYGGETLLIGSGLYSKPPKSKKTKEVKHG